MTDIMREVLLYLIGAVSIGFIFGYLISKAFLKGNYDKKLKQISYLMRKKNSENIILKDQVNTLKAEYRNQKLKKSDFTDIKISNIQPHDEIEDIEEVEKT